MSERTVPEVRFRGFSGEWERLKLSDVADIVGGGTPSTQIPEYWNGEIAWYAPTEIGKFAYADRSQKTITEFGFEKCSAKMLPANTTVLFTSRAGIGDMAILRHEATTNQGFQSFVLKKGNIPYFLYSSGFLIKNYALVNASGSIFLEISGKQLGNMDYKIPIIAEQTKIGEFFKKLDDLIAQNQKKYDKLVNMKKACLDKMFPKDGADTPEVRFKGFTKAWERCKFRKIVDKYEEPVQTPTDGYMRLGIRSHAKGTFHSYVEKGRELQTAKMYKVVAGNFIVNITFGWEHAVAVTGEDDAGKLVSHRFPQFKFCDGINPKFFKYVIIDTNFRHHLWLSSPGGAGRNRVLKINEMLEYEMIFPCENEQTAIGTFFQTLDNLITLRKTELEKLKNIKKACLDKMFI